MDLNDEEKDCLLKCIYTREQIIRKEARMFKELKEKAQDMLEMVKSCDYLIESHQEEYECLKKLKRKLIKDCDETDV